MSTPQIASILEELAKQCCSVIKDGQTIDHRRIDELTLSLSINGWQRHSQDGPPLSVQLRRRVEDHLPGQTKHRVGEIQAVVDAVVDSYERASFEASAPDAGQTDPKDSVTANQRQNYMS